MKEKNVDRVYREFLGSEGMMTTQQLMEKTGLPRSSVSYACSFLVASGKIERGLGMRGLFVLPKQGPPGGSTPPK